MRRAQSKKDSGLPNVARVCILLLSIMKYFERNHQRIYYINLKCTDYTKKGTLENLGSSSRSSFHLIYIRMLLLLDKYLQSFVL